MFVWLLLECKADKKEEEIMHYQNFIKQGLNATDAAVKAIPLVQAGNFLPYDKATDEDKEETETKEEDDIKNIVDIISSLAKEKQYDDIVKLIQDDILKDYQTIQTHFSADDDETMKDITTISLNLDLVENFYSMCYSLPNPSIAMTISISTLSIIKQLANDSKNFDSSMDLEPIVFLLTNSTLLSDPDNHKMFLSTLNTAISELNPKCQKILVKFFSNYNQEKLSSLIDLMHMYITCGLLYSSEPRNTILKALNTMEIFYKANNISRVVKYNYFYNDALNEYDEEIILLEYGKWKSRSREDLSICNYPFALEPKTKREILNLDNHIQMNERYRSSVINGLFGGGMMQPFLVLVIDRNDIINDTLQQLGRFSNDDLKKPLKVKFKGEEGVDAGGVKREFFLVLMRELFDQKYGMYSYFEETKLYYFAGNSFESKMQYELLGKLFGLAVYNDVILQDIFPLSIFKKLCNVDVNLSDYHELCPVSAKSLQQLLDFEGDIYETMCLNFTISSGNIHDTWGTGTEIELCEGGKDKIVTQSNKHEYVNLYVNYQLNSAIDGQFIAFKRGFEKVTGGESIMLFNPEELQLLVCGSPDFDFKALEKVTTYEDGYTVESRIIIEFWEIVHDLDIENKKKLLAFSTGSDRVPIEGLSGMRFVVGRNGPDSNRLPTAHSCFNHLLLPEYSSKEKLKSFLLISINQSEGFGLI